MASMMKKGFLRPLRYLSQIFEGREAEMQIGFPTNVRHVAHIGMDSTDEGPSWMKEYHSAPLPTAIDGSDSSAAGSIIWASADMVLVGGLEEPRLSGCSSSASASAGPTREESPYMSPETSPFQQAERRVDAELSSSRGNGIAKKGRRYKKKEGVEAPTDSISGQELPAVPKKSRRRKQKDSEANKTPVGPSRLKDCSTDAAAAKEIDKIMLQPQVMKPLAITS